MSDAFVVPFAGSKMAGAFAGEQADSLAEGIGSSYGIIGYKGKVWSLRYRGEKHVFSRPDDGTPSPYIDVIILRSPPVKSKSYYPREEGFDPNSNDGKRPTCSAIDGITPDADIAVPQATACAICPRNEWKTDANGKKSRDCADAKRLAVLVMPVQTAALLGSPLLEPVYLRVPPASLNDLAVMGDTMEKQGFKHFAFVTRVSFDPEQPHPKMIFRPIQQLTDAEAPVVLDLRRDPMAMRITGEDVIANRPLAIAHQGAQVQQVAPVAQPPAQVAAPAPAVVQAAPAPAPAPVAALAAAPSLVTGLAGLSVSPAPSVAPAAIASTAAPVAAVAPASTPSAPAASASLFSGLGAPTGLTAAVNNGAAAPVGPILELQANPPAGAAPQTAEDVGQPADSDLDLDARVAKLLEVA